MKKIALCSLLICLGCINYAAAAAAKTGSCEFTKSADSSASDEELWYSATGADADRKASALQCEDPSKDNDEKSCSAGIYVMFSSKTVPHYRSSVKRGLGPNFYTCNTRGNDTWDAKNKENLPECNADVKTTVPGDNTLGYLKEIKDARGNAAYVGVCKIKEVKDSNCDVKICHEGACYVIPRDCSLVGKCDGKKVGDSCSYSGSHAKASSCIEVQRKSTSAKELTCAAKECDKDYVLWLSGKTKKDPKPVSMGVCHKESTVIAQCKKGCGCGKNEECVPNYMNNPNAGFGGKAYFDCHCVAKDGGGNTPDVTPVVKETPKGDCEYTFNQTIKCADGASYSGEHTVSFSKAELGTPNCPTFEERFANDVTETLKLVDKVCMAKAGVKSAPDFTPDFEEEKTVVVEENAEFNSAKESLDAFFKATESSASGLKTADGKFNTVRLASDISAGVVLGTVGGVVSGVVIKKKQVEKGFEALHCTVGGQNIADWGDTFEVGLQK